MGEASGVVVNHAQGAHFERGLRAFFEYRDLGISQATRGKVVAHVIRAVPGAELENPAHKHKTEFQMVYVLRGWIEFEYDGFGKTRLEAGSSVYQPPGIGHREIAHSDDLEMLEIVMPANFETEMVAGVQPRG
jgi:quercetin dioxygenase-like cupin family protein